MCDHHAFSKRWQRNFIREPWWRLCLPKNIGSVGHELIAIYEQRLKKVKHKQLQHGSQEVQFKSSVLPDYLTKERSCFHPHPKLENNRLENDRDAKNDPLERTKLPKALGLVAQP